MHVIVPFMAKISFHVKKIKRMIQTKIWQCIFMGGIMPLIQLFHNSETLVATYWFNIKCNLQKRPANESEPLSEQIVHLWWTGSK